MLARGGVFGTKRVVRHLWRLSAYRFLLRRGRFFWDGRRCFLRNGEGRRFGLCRVFATDAAGGLACENVVDEIRASTPSCLAEIVKFFGGI